MTASRRGSTWLGAVGVGAVAALLALPFLAGCRQKEEPIPEGATYYEGQMTPKSQSQGAGGGPSPGAGGSN
ncbi:MAG TPA: hypothetical protein VLH79_10260 [Chthonomonadales bacterium]|nr:hypothetical protein [Chthonomonadales bacterium]